MSESNDCFIHSYNQSFISLLFGFEFDFCFYLSLNQLMFKYKQSLDKRLSLNVYRVGNYTTKSIMTYILTPFINVRQNNYLDTLAVKND